MSYIEEENEKIINELMNSKKIIHGQFINYNQFLELYKQYEENINEIEFARILDINYSNHNAIKNNSKRTTQILKNTKKEITEEKEEIIEELLREGKIKAGQLTNYENFKRIYEPYKEKIEERDFAKMLGISYSNYKQMKNITGRRTRILKNREKEITEEEKEEIIEELLRDDKIKIGQAINYEYFKKIYEPYKEKIKETDFARLLGIAYGNYKTIKYRNERRARVLKNREKEMTAEEKEKIIEELLRDGKIKIGQSINYEYFKKIYEPYKEKMVEIDFAKMLEISYSNYNQVKNLGQRAKILKGKQKELTEEEKEEIIEKLLRDGKIKIGQAINYEYFKKIYEPYKEKIKETDFANILGISYANWNTIKNRSERRARMLKNREKEITEEEKEEIIEELLRDGKIKIGQVINYEYFKKIYEPYKEKIKEIDFANILGISYSNYKSIKNKEQRAQIYDYRDKEKINRVKYILKNEIRYYELEEIENICKKFNIEINTFLKYICCGGKYENLSNYIELLKNKKRIWIGKAKCSRKFANKHAETMMECAKQRSSVLCKKYGCSNEQQDIASNSIMHILEQCIDIEKNFGDNDENAKNIICGRIYLYIKYSCLNKIKKPKEFGFYRKFTYKGSEEETRVFDRGIKDKSQNIQDEVEEKILDEIKNRQEMNTEEECIELLKMNVEAGFPREEALKRTGEALGMSPEEMLESIQKYLIEHKRARKTGSGSYIVGEGDEDER